MDILQLWGGIFYLLNKIFLSLSEKGKEKLRLYSWISYLIGAPAWIIILSIKHDWIATTIELGGIPSMILGIIIEIQRKEINPIWIKITKYLVYLFLSIGIIYSLYYFKGLKQVSQILELGLTSGYLIGTYLLAKRNNKGWYWFFLMNSSTALLMLIQDKPILAIQQLVSLGFVIKGIIDSKNKKALK